MTVLEHLFMMILGICIFSLVTISVDHKKCKKDYGVEFCTTVTIPTEFAVVIEDVKNEVQ